MYRRKPLKFWLLIVAGCMYLIGCSFGNNLPPHQEMETYVDARLEFTLRYPAAWAPYLSTTGAGHYAHYSVTWDVAAEGLNKDTSLTVVSMPRYLLLPGQEPEDILVDLYQDLAIDPRSEELLPAGNALKLTGHNQHRVVWAWVLAHDSRYYMVSIAAPPQRFERQVKLFNQIASSFQPYR